MVECRGGFLCCLSVFFPSLRLSIFLAMLVSVLVSVGRISSDRDLLDLCLLALTLPEVGVWMDVGELYLLDSSREPDVGDSMRAHL
jgi:uncharacterized membrane protein YqaE (UPF0057 family)